MAEELVQNAPQASPLARAKEYYEDLKQEMRRVTWPTWDQVRATTAVVIAAVFAFSAYFFVVDTIIGRAIQKLFDTFAAR
jgi:preprotein translocase subunit SecE